MVPTNNAVTVIRAATNKRYGRADKLRIAFGMGFPFKGLKEQVRVI